MAGTGSTMIEAGGFQNAMNLGQHALDVLYARNYIFIRGCQFDVISKSFDYAQRLA